MLARDTLGERRDALAGDIEDLAAWRIETMDLLANGRVRVRTPVHPKTGSTRMELDILEMIRRLCAQIPDPRQHMVTCYG